MEDVFAFIKLLEEKFWNALDIYFCRQINTIVYNCKIALYQFILSLFTNANSNGPLLMCCYVKYDLKVHNTAQSSI